MSDTVTFDQYWRSGPEPGNLTNHWYRFDPLSGSPATGATIVSSTQVDLTFVDGERGDDDLTVDTLLTDWGGPATATPTAVTLHTLAAARQPELLAAAAQAVMAVAATLGVALGRRRRRA